MKRKDIFEQGWKIGDQVLYYRTANAITSFHLQQKKSVASASTRNISDLTVQSQDSTSTTSVLTSACRQRDTSPFLSNSDTDNRRLNQLPDEKDGKLSMCRDTLKWCYRI